MCRKRVATTSDLSQPRPRPPSSSLLPSFKLLSSFFFLPRTISFLSLSSAIHRSISLISKTPTFSLFPNTSLYPWTLHRHTSDRLISSALCLPDIHFAKVARTILLIGLVPLLRQNSARMGSYKHSLIAASSFFLILDAFVVAARVYVRIRLVRAFGCDDALLCLSFVSVIRYFQNNFC